MQITIKPYSSLWGKVCFESYSRNSEKLQSGGEGTGENGQLGILVFYNI